MKVKPKLKPPAKAPAPAPETFSLAEMCRFLSLTSMQIRNLREAGMPCTSDGRHPRFPPEAVRWYIERKVAEVSRGMGDDSKQRKELAEAILKEMEVEEKQKSLVSYSVATEWFDAACRRLADAVRNIAPKIAAIDGVTYAERVAQAQGVIGELLGHLRAGEDVPDAEPDEIG